MIAINLKRAPKKCNRITPNVGPVKTPTDIDIAWMAGLFEGEGCLKSHKGKKTAVCLYQKDPEILYRCREFLGGSISKISGPDTHLHMLNVCGDVGRKFLQSIYPLMSTRRKLQIEQHGGLTLTGRGQQLIGTSAERMAVREGMTAKQKQVESTAAYKARNPEKDRAYQRKRYWERKALKQSSAISEMVQ